MLRRDLFKWMAGAASALVLGKKLPAAELKKESEMVVFDIEQPLMRPLFPARIRPGEPITFEALGNIRRAFVTNQDPRLRVKEPTHLIIPKARAQEALDLATWECGGDCPDIMKPTRLHGYWLGVGVRVMDVDDVYFRWCPDGAEPFDFVYRDNKLYKGMFVGEHRIDLHKFRSSSGLPPSSFL